MNSFECGVYRPNKALIFFTLKWVEGELKPINRHMRGLIWLAWKFLWQQLAEIGSDGLGRFDPNKAIKGMFRMHHTAVLAALEDYRLVQQAKRAGARKKCSREQEEAEVFRVWPYVTITKDELGRHTLKYTKAYYNILKASEITPAEDIAPPDD